MPKNKLSEKEVLQSCLQLLDIYKIFNWRNNTGALKTEKSFMRFGVKGSPDIIALHDNAFIGIECKSTIGKQSDSQKEFQKKVEKAGGFYFLVRSSEQLEELLDKHYLIN